MADHSRITLKQIAVEAHCSITIASKVLNHARSSAMVSDSRRRQVLEVARRLGYRANYHAQALKSGRSRALGLLLDPPTPHEGAQIWLRKLVEGVELQARDEGLGLLTLGPTRQHPIMARGLELALDGRVDALIAPGAKYALREFDLSALPIPMVLLWDDRWNTGLPYAGLDEEPGLRDLIRHARELGHREAVWLSYADARGLEIVPDRWASLAGLAQKAGLQLIDRRLSAPPEQGAPDLASRMEYARQAARAALPRLGAATFVICYNDALAMGLCAALQESGRRVPQEISVAGFDDLFACFGQPPLTTVSLELVEVGRRAARMALQRIPVPHGASGKLPSVERVPAKLVIRSSTGPVQP
ncbi:MAG: LacI family DNA-binding transcriptional regulator [Planctomycetes bacterium]|nr:LacI family DNA-binding transcriptional regulator [Planctomycetota bacterium]